MYAIAQQAINSFNAARQSAAIPALGRGSSLASRVVLSL